jgi:hypothetical protein
MRAHVELSPAEKRVLTMLTAEERQALAAQMMETLSEELEWVVAVERANLAAETAQALMASVEVPTPPPSVVAQNQRYRWPSAARAAKR